MADEVSLSFVMPGEAMANLAHWRDAPPAFLADAGFVRIDESYESLVYEANVTSRYMKVMMLGFARTLYRLAVTFRAEGAADTRVTVIGQATEDARVALVGYANGFG
jgi:hypothetical protein